MDIINKATEPQGQDVAEPRRGRGRPKTGRKRRPKILYQPVVQEAEILAAPGTEDLVLAEAPMEDRKNNTIKMVDYPTDGETIGTAK